MTPEQRLNVVFDLAELGREMRRAKLRRQHPDETPEQIDERLLRWLLSVPSVSGPDFVRRSL